MHLDFWESREMVDAVQKALQRASARAARLAEADASAGKDADGAPEKESKEDKRLREAKEGSRTITV